MKYILFSLILLATVCQAETYPSCDLRDSKTIELYPDGEKGLIEVSIKGAPCYKAELKIDIRASGILVYSYKAPFKPHVAIDWQDLTVEDAEAFLKSAYAPYHFIECHELLPPAVQDGDPTGYNFNSLLVAKPEYEKYRSSNCKAFIHLVQYETSRAVVFPSDSKKGVPVSEFGS